jgi:hypothetical protein
LEDLLTQYQVNMAWVNGQRVVELASATDSNSAGPAALGAGVTDLLRCIEHADKIKELSRLPGRRYNGPDARLMAAIKIQATFRMYRRRKQFRRHQMQAYSAARIQDVWRRHAARTHTRSTADALWRSKLERWRANVQQPFMTRWNTHWVHKQRVAVHVPSLSVRAHQRASLHNFAVRENSQLSRLCDARNPQVDVVCCKPLSPSSLRLRL